MNAEAARGESPSSRIAIGQNYRNLLYQRTDVDSVMPFADKSQQVAA
jgi:hypothetical protein